MTRAWIYLILAIVTEVAGTLMLSESGHSGKIWIYCVMYVFISASYTLLSFALQKIAVGIAIAIWEGFGTALITLISILFLKEGASLQKILGISLAFIGIILMRFGEKEPQEEESKPHLQPGSTHS
jgi:spermidine export protein MdtJ